MRRIRARSFAVACAKLAVVVASGCAALGAAEPPQGTPAAQTGAARVQELEQAAQAEMQREQFAEAVKHFREITRLTPKNAGAFYNLGAAEAASGELPAALKSLHTASYLDPLNPLPLVMLVRVNFATGDIDNLKASLHEAAARFPNDGEIHQLLARFLTEKNQLDLALAESLRAQRAGAADGASRLGLAVLENALGAYHDAVLNASALQQQAALPAKLRAAAAGVAGLSYDGLGQREDAIAQLREAIRLDPLRETSYLALAYLLEQAQNYAGAVAVLEQGRENIAGSAAFLLPLGSNLVRADKCEEGIAILRELLRRAPDETDAYLQIADGFRKTGRPEQEVQILRDLQRRKPEYPMLGFLIARALFNVDPPDYAKVLDELAQAEKASPSDADIFYLRGKVYTQMNREIEAIAAFRRAIELRPMDPGPYYQLGRLYQKHGKPELAKQQFDRMKSLEENSTPK